MHRIPLIVEDYQLSHSTENVIVDDSYAALSKRDTELRYKPALLVWKDGFLDKELKQHFSRPNWPVDLVKAFGPSEWRWIMKYPEEGELVNESMLILEKAAGLHGRPDGNIHLTLELRSYDVRDSDVGGLNWWRSRASAVRGELSSATCLLTGSWKYCQRWSVLEAAYSLSNCRSSSLKTEPHRKAH